MYWPRRGGARRHELVVSRIAADGSVLVKAVDGQGVSRRLSSDRLLARREDDQGRFYSFVRWSPRRYRTWASVAAVGESEAILIIPEWHPAIPVRVSSRSLPVGAREPGDWLAVSADLSQPTAAALEVAPLEATVAPAEVPKVVWSAPAASADPRPEAGEGCGDIVLELVDSLEQRSFFLTDRPKDLEVGARVYLPRADEVVGYLTVASVRVSPNGLRLDCEGELSAVDPPIPMNGPRRTAGWRWRWWSAPLG